MMSRSRATLLPLLLTILALPAILLAAWPEDAATDLFIGDGPGEQSVPHLVMALDGACYAGWYDNSSGNYNLAVQRLDAQGNEVWAHNGLLASDQPQDSWVMDWDLAAAGDDAVTAVRDIRTGNPTVSVNRITPAGDFPWGPNGITVASADAFIGPPNLAVTGDGDVAVVWEVHPNVGDDHIRIQRIAPDGSLRYADGGLILSGTSSGVPGRPQVIAAGTSDVIVAWVSDDTFMGDRRVAIHKYDANGLNIWLQPMGVFDVGSLPMGHNYGLQGDGAGGAVISWEAGAGLLIYSYVQHVDAFSIWLFPYGGVRATTDNSFNEYLGEVVYDQASDAVLMFWTRANSSQNQFGVMGQKFSATGDRLWGDLGRTFVPMSASSVNFLNAAPNAAGITVAWLGNPSGVWGQDVVTAMLVDLAGNVMWDPAVIDAATTLSNKSRLQAAGTEDGSTRLVWMDERGGTPDVLAKSMNIDGSFGGGTVSIEDPDQPVDEVPVVAVALGQNFPNPFNPTTTIVFNLPRSEQVSVTIHDVQGRLVRTLVDGVRGEGRHTVVWSGATDVGRRAASGTYIYRLQTENRVVSRTMVLAK